MTRHGMVRLILTSDTDGQDIVVETTNMDHTEAVDALKRTWEICGDNSSYAEPHERQYEKWICQEPHMRKPEFAVRFLSKS